jgi:rfaE bifunctional protein nucleotidyltransferase chain/domain
LVVGLNGDASVRLLKGEGRPINPQHLRAKLLVALKAVDIVCIFEGIRCADFLTACKPDVYVKGGDYNLKTLDPSERSVLDPKTRIEFVSLTEGVSTTAVIQKVVKRVMAAIP